MADEGQYSVTPGDNIRADGMITNVQFTPASLQKK